MPISMTRFYLQAEWIFLVMNKKFRHLSLYIFLLTSVYLNSVNAQVGTEYDLQFLASANGISATANRRLSSSEANSFELTNTLSASLAGQVVSSIEEVSRLELINNKYRPVSYRYLQTGLSQETRAVNYNWDALIAVSSENEESWTLELAAETYDQLSQQIAIREKLIAGDSELHFSVIDDQAIEQYRYRVIGDEVLSTAVGELDTTKVERVRDSDDERETVFWLAKDWQFVLVRIDQYISGLTIQLELNAGSVNGTTIQGLLN